MTTISRPWQAFWVVTAVIVLTDSFFIFINYQSNWQMLDQEIGRRNDALRSGFQISLMSSATNMQQIATYIANDIHVPEAFLKGKLAVEAEGGGPGGREAARMRAALFAHVKPGWDKMQKNYDVRQLHFHLGPGSLSFLRVHAPHKFGDRMDEVRYTVVDCNRTQAPTKGFETGRVYSGIRGVVPVFATDPHTGKQVHVGALEAGTSMASLVNYLSSATGYHIAALLNRDHLEKYVWPEYLNSRLEKDLIGDSLVIEEAKAEDLPLLKMPEVIDVIFNNHPLILSERDPPLAISSFPFKDYRQASLPKGKPAGHIVAWHDISPELHALKKGLLINILYGLMVFALVETILFASWKLGIQKLELVIQERTKDLEEANLLLQKEMRFRTEAEEKFRHILQEAPVCIASQTTRGEALSLNPACAQILGYDSQEALMDGIGRKGENLFADPAEYRHFQNILKQNRVTENFECKARKKDGSDIWVSINACIREDRNIADVKWVDSFIIDVNERKKLEKLKEEVEHITRHDLKGPLTGIINIPALIRREKGLTALQEKYLDNIKVAGFRMIEMINMSLNLYKMEMEQYQFAPIDINFKELVQRVIDELEGFSSQMEISIRFDIKEGADYGQEAFIAPGEEILCVTLFQNLLKNAIEASPEDGNVSVFLSRTQGHIQVRIHNKGKVPDQIFPHFFDKYATFGKSGGTGLGTYSAKLFTQIHNGEIEMTSDDETGTMLTIRFPAGPETGSRPKPT
ncbi:ATP-binding protein [uncultured Desulfobacter sp.]|uniref:ATP-binding protein n=1 Tax=uncultured Desulfobacter sp. TaxID=240139 RepID=UPI002AAA7F7B|nr:ATP-binding protein [uncultured Desulfobacter sp.]